jgi:phosphatidylglycerophosphate synthase
VSFGAVFSGKLKMFIQSFAIGTVVIKMAHVQTATWGYWFTVITYLIMLLVTVVSGIHATQRKSWKAAVQKETTVEK